MRWKGLFDRSGIPYQCSPPATLSQLNDAGKALGMALPAELTSCLLESNGVSGEHGLGVIWPVEHLVKTNLEFRSNVDFAELYMPFDAMLFFADAGNGNQYFYPIQSGEIRRDDIFLWDSRLWCEPNLEAYVTRQNKPIDQ